MARIRTFDSRVYQAGTYGPFALDSFSRDNAEGVEIFLSVESWPDGLLANITLVFDNGTTQVLPISKPGLDKLGNVQTTLRMRVWFPVDDDGTIKGKRQTTRCDATIEVLQPFRTALTVQAF